MTPLHHLALADHVATESRRQMLRDVACVIPLLTAIWLCTTAWLAPDYLAVVVNERKAVILNLAIWNGVASMAIVLLSIRALSRKTTQPISQIFVWGTFAVGVSGAFFSGYGLRALGFHLLLLILVYVCFQSGSVFSRRFFWTLLALVVVTAGGEMAGWIAGATPQRQPHPIAGVSVSVFIFATLMLMFWRFEQRFNRLRELQIDQRLALRNSLAKMRNALERRGAFSRLLSHSTRTPLAGIQFVTDLLQRPIINAAVVQRTLASLQRHAYRLRMMAVHLELARRMREPFLETQHHTLDVYSIWSQSLLNISTEASHRNIQLELAVDSDLSDTVVPVEARIVSDLLQMLMDNAVKHQTGGQIQVAFIRSCSDFRIEVRDQGPGLSEAQAANLFKPLGIAAADGGDASMEGLGLGLPIIRTLCDQVGGRCGWHRGESTGSTFWVSFPSIAEMSALQPAANIAEVSSPARPATVSAADTNVGGVAFADHSTPEDVTPQGASLATRDTPAAGTLLSAYGMTDRLVALYVGAIALLAAVNIANQSIQLMRGHLLSRPAIVNSFIMGAAAVVALLLIRRKMADFAVLTLLAGMVIGAVHIVLGVGLGPRAPIMLLMSAAISLAYYQFGSKAGMGMTVLSCAIAIGGFWMENAGLLPGTEGELFPPTTNGLVALLGVYGLNFITVHDMQKRSERMLNHMQSENEELQSAMQLCALADSSQDRFLDGVSPRLIADCRELAALCSELGGSPPGTRHQFELLQAVKRMNRRVVAGFDAAVSAVEQPLLAEGSPPPHSNMRANTVPSGATDAPLRAGDATHASANRRA